MLSARVNVEHRPVQAVIIAESIWKFYLHIYYYVSKLFSIDILNK